MGRTDDHDSRKCRVTTAKFCKSRRSDRPGMDVTGVGSDHGFGRGRCAGVTTSKQVKNPPPQPIGIGWVEAAGDGRAPDNHVFRPACILLGLHLMTMSSFKRLRLHAA